MAPMNRVAGLGEEEQPGKPANRLAGIGLVVDLDVHRRERLDVSPDSLDHNRAEFHRPAALGRLRRREEGPATADHLQLLHDLQRPAIQVETIELKPSRLTLAKPRACPNQGQRLIPARTPTWTSQRGRQRVDLLGRPDEHVLAGKVGQLNALTR